MIELPLRLLADEPAVPLYHPPDGVPDVRFARLVTEVWRRLPWGITTAILERWRYLPDEPAIALVPSLPAARGGRNPAFVVSDGGLLVFDGGWVRRRTDRQVRAVIAHELAHEYAESSDPGFHGRTRPDRRRARDRRERRLDALVESWGFSMRSVRTWRGDRLGPPDARRYPAEALAWLVDNAPRERNRRGRGSAADDAFAKRVRRALEGCIPHKSGRYRGTKIGYDPDNHNANCHLGVGDREPPAGRGGAATGDRHGRTASQSGGGAHHRGGDRGARGAAGGKSTTHKPEQRASVFKEVYRHVLNTGAYRSPAKAEALIREIVRDGEKAKIPGPDVAEVAIAALLGHDLLSHGRHGFDTVSPAGWWRGDGTVARVDGKLSRSNGYADKYDSKLGRILEYLEKRGVPAYLVIAKGHGVYLHVGIDPSETPRLYEQGGKTARRGVVAPERLNNGIDGKGGPVPFVKLAGWDNIHDLGGATKEQITQLRRRVQTALGSLDMKKLKRHVNRQIDAATDQNVDDLLKIVPKKVIRKAVEKDVRATARAAAAKDVGATARAAAAKDSATTARAGLDAMTAEEREAIFREYVRKK